MIYALLFATFAWTQTNPTAVSAEGISEPAQVIYKTKSPKLGAFQVLCSQRKLSPDKELSFRFRAGSKKMKRPKEFLRVQTYNSCNQYKFKLSPDLQLTYVSPPGERSDEPGAKVTRTYVWKNAELKFEKSKEETFSPYKDIQARYRKILATAALPKAEKLIIANQKKIEDYIQIHKEEAKSLCEDFFNAYRSYGENLFKEKDYEQSFNIFLSLKRKFGDPQHAFFDSKSKNGSMALVCPSENSNPDISEDYFYSFARRYLNHIEFVPFMVQKVRRSLYQNTEESKELALQVLKYVTFLLKSAPRDFQLENQRQLVGAWGSLIRGNPEHPQYDRLLDEDTHLVFLLAERKSCADVPPEVIKRISQKKDNPELLKEMTLTAADDSYAEGLEKSAVFEYRQFVLGRVLLKKCEEIPKTVYERYFKYISAQPYQN